MPTAVTVGLRSIYLTAMAGLALSGPHASMEQPAGTAAVWSWYGILAVSCACLPWLARHLASHRVTLMLAALAALLAGLGLRPWLDDDVYRYIWDGAVGAQGLTPALHAPVDRVISVADHTIDRIAFQQVPSVYPPAAQLFFQSVYRIAGENLRGWSCAFLGITLLLLWCLAGCAQRYRVPIGFAAILLLHPVMIKEFADSYHVDVLGLLLVGLAYRWSLTGMKADVVAGVLLGSAIMVKPTAVLCLLLYPVSGWRQLLLVWSAAVTTAAVWCWWYFPTLDAGIYYLQLLSYFHDYWIFNPGVAVWLQMVPGMSTALSLAVLVLSAAASVRAACNHALRWRILAIHLAGAFLVLAKVVNPWYLFWLWPPMLALPWSGLPRSVRTYVAWQLSPWMVLPVCAAFGSYGFWIESRDLPIWRWTMWGIWFSYTVSLVALLRWRWWPTNRQCHWNSREALQSDSLRF